MKRCLALLLFLSSAIGPAQITTATVSGTILDGSGAALVGATATALNLDTGIARSGVSNEAGQYSVPSLPPGSYRIEASAPGFQNTARTGVVLQIGQEVRFDFTLTAGAEKEEVVVTALCTLTDTETAAVGTVIDNRRVVEMPLNGRQFYSLALLVPGVYQPVSGSTIGFRGGMNVAGSNEVSNYFTLDGINNNDQGISGPSLRPSIDAIQEFKFYTGTYEAEFGHNTGGQVVVTTKSGTNRYHGALFEFLRNDYVDAKPFFTPVGVKPPLKRNQFGGALGGPLQKSRMFFFFSYEGLRSRRGIARQTVVPTSSMRNGTFPSAIHAPSGYAASSVVKNADGTYSIQPSVFTSAQLSAYDTGKALLSFYPLPNLGGSGNNYAFSGLEKESINQYSLRLDRVLRTSDMVFASLNYFSNPLFTPNNILCGNYSIPGFNCVAELVTQLYGGGWTHLFSPNLLNDFRGGFQRLRQPRFIQTPYNFDERYGIPAYDGNPPHIGGVPTVAVSGYASFGNASNLPQDRADNTFDVNDSLWWHRGRHNFKIGGEYTRFHQNQIFFAYGSGGLTFTGLNTGNAIADTLLGLPSIAIRNPAAPTIHLRDTYAAVYLQDEYKAASNLTLNYGLRWESFAPISAADDRISSFDPVAGTPIQTGRNGYPRHPYAVFNGAFAPRVGFSYQPFGGQRTVVRGGFGIAYNAATTGNGFIFILTSPPVHQLNTYVGLGLKLPNPFVGNGAPALTPGGSARSYRPGQVAQYSFGVQHQLSRSLVFDVSYFGASGVHLTNQRNLNQPRPNVTVAAANATRPYPGLGNISWVEAEGNSNYNSLQLKLEKRYSNGLTLLISDTYGKSLDDTNGVATSSSASPTYPQDSQNVHAEYGRSDFDVRNRLVISPVYELPLGEGKPYLRHGLASRLASGFQISAIFTTQTSSPFTAGLATSVVASNTGNSSLGAGIDRPNRISGQDPNRGPKSYRQWFNTAAFAAPEIGTFGNAGRNIVKGPGFTDLDVGVARRFQLTREATLQFRGEVFNLCNHPNFALPNGLLGTSTFGSISSTAADPREIQLALKVLF